MKSPEEVVLSPNDSARLTPPPKARQRSMGNSWRLGFKYLNMGKAYFKLQICIVVIQLTLQAFSLVPRRQNKQDGSVRTLCISLL